MSGKNELSLAPELLVKAEIATEFDTLGIGVDLSAGTKEKNDYTVMVLGGRIGDKIHIIDYRRLRVMGNLEKLDALKELLMTGQSLGVKKMAHISQHIQHVIFGQRQCSTKHL